MDKKKYLGTPIYSLYINHLYILYSCYGRDYHTLLINWINFLFENNVKENKKKGKDYKLLEKKILKVYYFGSSNTISSEEQFIQRLKWNNYDKDTCGDIRGYAFYGSNIITMVNNFFKNKLILSLLLICIIIIINIIIIVIIKKKKATHKK